MLTHLPTKTASVEVVPMGQQQHTMYFDRVAKYKKRAAEVKKINPTSVASRPRRWNILFPNPG